MEQWGLPILCLVALYFLYFFRLSGTGLLKEDEPRYASIGREMARSGDWITPRLWGEPWFEKPPLLYWMTSLSFRLGLSEDVAPRIGGAVLSVLFLVFFYWFLRREFGERPAWFSTAILATSAWWLAYSYVGVTDLPMSVFFSTAMLLGMMWLRTGSARWLNVAAISLGFAVLGKSLVPLALSIPFAWHARSRWKELLNWRPVGCFLLVAAPWYVLCYLKNGRAFIDTLFWQQQFGRIHSAALGHARPFWFYVPVLLGALFPWTPAIALLLRRRFYSDSRRIFLLLWLLFGLVFFSVILNKLPGYILPLLPAAAALAGIALAEAKVGAARWSLFASAGLLCLVFPLASVLPRALAVGLSRADIPSWSLWWVVPVGLAAFVWLLEARGRRTAAVSIITVAVTGAIIYLKLVSFPAIDSTVSARPLWRQIAPIKDRVCVDAISDDSWRYGLNYYSVEPLPRCDEVPRPMRVMQAEGLPASIK